MRNRWGILVLWGMLCLPWIAHAQSDACGQTLAPLDFETVTVSTTAIGLTAAKADLAVAAYVTVEGAAGFRWLVTGTPTSAIGHLVDPPTSNNATLNLGRWFCGRTNLLSLRMTRSGASDAILRVSYFRPG